jgi:peptide/nickel transport system substrate-binding protein
MTIQKKKRFFVKNLCISLLLYILVFSGCIDNYIVDEKIDDLELTIGLGYDSYIQYPFNDFLTIQALSINSNIYNSLVEFNENFGIVPSLAENWYNPDDLTWRFILRKDVKFHNGYNFSAEDVKYTIERIIEDKNNSVYLHFTIVKEINILDNFTIDVITFKPDPLMLNYLAYVFIVSQQYSNESTGMIPIGSGPYQYKEYIENQSFELERFDEYWGGKPKYKNVEINFFSDYQEKLDALSLGIVDLIDYVQQIDVERLINEDEIKSVGFFSPIVYYLSFDFRKNDSCCFSGINPVSDLRVRKAIYHAINLENIIENTSSVLLGPASQYINSNTIGFNPEIERLPYDIDKAHQYMKKAGYEEGFEIELDCRDISFIMNTSLKIYNQLSEINITVNVNILPRSEYIQKVYIDRNSSFYLTGWQVDSGDAGEIFNGILRSVDEENGFGDFNYGYYSNHEIDNITDKINSEMNPKERISLMHDGFEIAFENVTCIPLYILKFIYLMKEEISFIPRADRFIKFDNIEFENTKNYI